MDLINKDDLNRYRPYLNLILNYIEKDPELLDALDGKDYGILYSRIKDIIRLTNDSGLRQLDNIPNIITILLITMGVEPQDILNSTGEVWYNMFEGIGIKEITIPRSTGMLPVDSFKNCRNLEKIIIQGNNDAVFNFDIYCLEECENLKEIYINRPIKMFPYVFGRTGPRDRQIGTKVTLYTNKEANFANVQLKERFKDIVWNSRIK